MLEAGTDIILKVCAKIANLRDGLYGETKVQWFTKTKAVTSPI
jgi:hypothetical protein